MALEHRRLEHRHPFFDLIADSASCRRKAAASLNGSTRTRPRFLQEQLRREPVASRLSRLDLDGRPVQHAGCGQLVDDRIDSLAENVVLSFVVYLGNGAFVTNIRARLGF